MLCCCNINKKMLVMLMLPLIVVGKWKAFNLINADLLLISSRRLWTLNFKVSLRVPQCFELLKHAEAKTEKKTIKLQTWMIRPQADCKHLVYLHLLTSGNTWKQNICRTCYFFPRMTWPPRGLNRGPLDAQRMWLSYCGFPTHLSQAKENLKVGCSFYTAKS